MKKQTNKINQISSKVKTISLTTLALAATSLTANADRIKNDAEAIEKLTGPNQSRAHSICVEVEPAFISMGAPRPGRPEMDSSFVGFQVKGSTPHASGGGSCEEVGPDEECSKGFVKVTSTAPIRCNIPIGL